MSIRDAFLALIENKLIPAERLDDAIKLSGIHPNKTQWLQFVDRLLLWLGALALAFSLLFFVAYNWADIGRFAKFGLVEFGLITAVLIAVLSPQKSSLWQPALFVAAILTGVLLALYGQTYQTGADPWQLFFSWALLITPWAIVAKLPSLWVMWLALLNLATLLHFKTFGSLFGIVLIPLLGGELGLLWCLFGLNIATLVVWESVSSNFVWLRARWAPGAISAAAGISITWLMLLLVTGFDRVSVLVAPLWLSWAGGVYAYYRFRRQDLFMLAGFAIAVSTVILTSVGRALTESLGEGAFLLLALLVIGVGGTAAIWLRNIHTQWSQ